MRKECNYCYPMPLFSNIPDIKDFTLDRLVCWLDEHGLESYRAKQIFKWVYLRQADIFDDMTDLPKHARTLLTNHFTINRLKIVHIETSKDGTKKFLFELNDGQHIETVLIPEENHHTLCISSQAGCAQGCKFCLTAKNGFARNLTPGEIIAQVRDIKKLHASDNLTNIVFMGMGEPLANYTNVIHAINVIINGDFGLQISCRKVTVSTAGMVPNLNKLSHDTNINLAVSLNASDNITRSMLMPINKTYPIEVLLDECRRYNMSECRKITIEYILIKGVNDSKEDAKRLASLLRPIRSKINLIPFNENKASKFKRPDKSTIDNFQKILLKNNYITIIRNSKGMDISAACGQLSSKQIKTTS